PLENTSVNAPMTSKASCRSSDEVMSSSQESRSLDSPTISFMLPSFSFIWISHFSRLPPDSPFSPNLVVPDDLPFLKNCCSCSIKPVYTSIGWMMVNSFLFSLVSEDEPSSDRTAKEDESEDSLRVD